MINWQEVKQNTGGTLFRAIVPGGWLVKEVQEVATVLHEQLTNGYAWTSSICFVPDPLHKWEL